MYTINECEMHKIKFNYLLKLQHFKGSSKKFIYIGNNSKLKISNLITHNVSIYLLKIRYLFTSKIN